MNAKLKPGRDTTSKIPEFNKKKANTYSSPVI